MPIKHLKILRSKLAAHRSRLKLGRWQSILVGLALLFGALALVGFFVLTLTLAWLSRDLPDPNSLLTRDVPQSTKIFDRTGQVLLYEIHGAEKRTLVKVGEIPDSVKWATIAVEDKDFYKHHGIYWKGLVRAFLVNTLQGRRIGGTSTLTQQFVKNAILTNERTITRKLKEVLLSLQIERKYTKDQILQLYLNEIPYGSTLYGIEAASRGYFGKPSKDLTLDESALLVALPQAPDFYNPYGLGSRGDNRVSLVRRRDLILDLMVEQGYVTKDAAEEAKKIETLKKLIPKRIGDIKAPHFVMWVRSQLVEAYGQRTVETGGLHVVTTLDWRLQQAGEEAVKKGVEKRGEQYKFTNAALVALGPKDGQVLAMVGSKDFYDEEHDGQVNVALRPRQPGSSMKPIVYAAGFMKGYLPETTLWDVNTTFKTEIKNYSPKNYDMRERGPVSIRMALQGSLNIPAVKMLYLVGVGRVLDLAEQMGYTTFDDRSRFGLSLVLGGGEVKLLEHAAAFGVFATEGVLQPTVGILKVEDAQGKTLEEWKLSDGKRVIDAQIARLISSVLSDNASRAYVFGAGNALTLPDRPVATKTGTTNNFHDAWTVGYTPSLVTGVWVGNMDNAEMKRGADGSVIAAPIWQTFMKEATKDSPKETFTHPTPPDTAKPVLLGKSFEKKVKIDKVSGKLATEFTPLDLVEERPFYEAHSILYYVDKDDPRGPAPSNPAADPQFGNWESAVKAWVEREQWHTTSTAPTETDDVHTAANLPQVTIQTPVQNATLSSRQFTITTSAAAPRRILSLTAKVEGYVVGTNYGGTGDLYAVLPNALEKGFHELTVEARDDVGNTGKATITINLTADPAPLTVTVTDPAPGSKVSLSSFPRSVTVTISDLSNINKADMYVQTPQGGTHLIGSDIKPSNNPLTFTWSSVPSPGTYALFTVTTNDGGTQITGDKTIVTVE
ncbi:MAG TPA: PBP1A family penicillin-binding protein [Candidatus Methylomirabilis sp.]|nr:PBP1A family penicillin-binding protein [Candidatus Methylomirabilis sp.]